MVVGSQESWKKWRELRANQSEARLQKLNKNTMLSLVYNKNTELTVQRKLCILSW